MHLIHASARFQSRKEVKAGNVIVEARKFVIASGSKAFIPAIPGLDQVPYFTNETIFEAERLPVHLIIIGGGASGSVLGLGLPSVGEKLIVDLLLMGVALGIVMLGAGSLILVRNRT